jgi:DNA-binding XRE family transcriptional regulator
MADDGRGFGGRLAGCRRVAGLSQQELAERSGLSVRAIGNLERGRARRPHPDTVRRLADALELRSEARDEFMAGAGRLPARGAVGGAGMTPSPFHGQSRPGAGSGTPVPRQLPPGIRHFTGRKAELDFLACLLHAPGAPDDAGTMVISAIGGTAGVGKTALAIHWAHQAAGQFPDGQLYVNLRGFPPRALRSHLPKPSAGSCTRSASRPSASRRSGTPRRPFTAAC